MTTTTSASRTILLSAFAAAFLGFACTEGAGALSDDQIVDAYIVSMKDRAPLEAVVEFNDDLMTCVAPAWSETFPDDTNRDWVSLRRGEVRSVPFADPSLPADPVWVFGPEEEIAESKNGNAIIFAAAPWAGQAALTCGGEVVSGSTIVLLSNASRMEQFGVAHDELLNRMSTAVDEAGLVGVVDRDLSQPVCPDTEAGCQ